MRLNTVRALIEKTVMNAAEAVQELYSEVSPRVFNVYDSMLKVVKDFMKDPHNRLLLVLTILLILIMTR